MKLYRISQEENNGYDTYDSAVVAAPDEETAKDIAPDNYSTRCVMVDWERAKRAYSDWAKTRDAVKVEYIGEAKEGTEQGVIVASFNAG